MREHFENLEAKVVLYTTNTSEQARGGQKYTHVPIEANHKRREDWRDVDEVPRGSICCNWEMMGHFATICGREGKGKGKGEDGDKGRAHYFIKQPSTHRRAERFVQIGEDLREDLRENRKVGDTQDSAGHAGELETSRQSVDGGSLASVRKIQTAEKVEVNPTKKRMNKSERVWIVGNVEEIKEAEENSDNSARQLDG